MRRISLLLVLVLAAPAFAQEDLSVEVRDALDRASAFLRSISTKGGYAGIYSKNLKLRWGEATYEPARRTEIWVQPPGTPTVGETFLRAYRITGDDAYLKAAREVGLALAWGQREVGGWDHRCDVAHAVVGSTEIVRKKGRCTLDDNITQGALRFLMDLESVVHEEWLSKTVQIGLSYMRAAQYRSGSWPQWYPLIGGYHDHATFNDATINDCISLMLEAYDRYGNLEDKASAVRGGDYIIASQLPVPQPGWAQQYDQEGKPAWARSFEPPGVCSAVTARNIRTLVKLYLHTGEERFLLPIPAAIDWLEVSRISANRWARLYELDTNRPIYGDRDGKVHYTLKEISAERRKGYSWEGNYGIASVMKYYREAKERGPEAFISREERPPTAAWRLKRLESLGRQVKRILRALDDQGRWLAGGKITTERFVKNAAKLLDYLELWNTKPRDE